MPPFAHAEARSDLDVDDWIARADAALYRAKAEGRNRIVEEEEGAKLGRAIHAHAS